MAAKQGKNNDQSRAYTTGSTIRFEEPQSGRKPKKTVTKVVLAAPDEFATGFLAFLRDNAVVGLAIGFVVGLQAQILIKQLISSFIDPAFQLLFGQKLTQRDFTLTFHGREAVFTWGMFIYVLLSFLFILGVIYLIYHIFKLDKLEKPKKSDIDKMKEIK